jgi:ribonuclease HI
MYFDGLVCNEGQGIDIVLVSPRNSTFDFSSRLKAHCTNNQAKYEALLFGLELLNSMGVTHVKVSGDSQLVVQQILERYQCLDGILNDCLERCWDIMRSFNEFDIRHICRVENSRANDLAQKASGYRVTRGKFHISENPVIRGVLSSQVADHLIGVVRPSALATDRLALGRRPCASDRNVALIDLANGATDTVNWRAPFVTYLYDPNIRTCRNIR